MLWVAGGNCVTASAVTATAGWYVILYYITIARLRLPIEWQNTLNLGFSIEERHLPGGAIGAAEPYWVQKAPLWPSLLPMFK